MHLNFKITNLFWYKFNQFFKGEYHNIINEMKIKVDIWTTMFLNTKTENIYNHHLIYPGEKQAEICLCFQRL